MGLKLNLELLNYRHVQGRKDPSRTFTVVEGIAKLPNGARSFCEVFLGSRQDFQPGPHVLDLDIQVNRDRRITAQPLTITPAAPVAAKPAA